MKNSIFILVIFSVISCSSSGQKQIVSSESQNTREVGKYRIVDTGQEKCFDNSSEIDAPKNDEPFYGQDAQFDGNKPSYTDNSDGTITDNVTGLIWQKSFEVMTYADAVKKVKSFKLANRSDWRIPTIKEAYSLIQFSGIDVSSQRMENLPQKAIPFLDTSYFDFKYGSNGHRVIDVQMLSSTIYQGKTMEGAETVFGVNLADGRIKGYPISSPDQQNSWKAPMDGKDIRPQRSERPEPGDARKGKIGGPRGEKYYTVRFVCGNNQYGKNNFIDNNDGTITDLATNLMWDQNDSKTSMNWEEALVFAQQKNKENYLGYNDWRLPNAKELQSIVDYSRSPQKTKSAAIKSLFSVTEILDERGETNYPFYWSSTTHEGQFGGEYAVYICFGEALGYMKEPWQNKAKLMDVHGAGAQRSDPKYGNPAKFPQGHGPQGDVIRINNFVRLVRDN